MSTTEGPWEVDASSNELVYVVRNLEAGVYLHFCPCCKRPITTMEKAQIIANNLNYLGDESLIMVKGMLE